MARGLDRDAVIHLKDQNPLRFDKFLRYGTPHHLIEKLLELLVLALLTLNLSINACPNDNI